MHYRNGREAKNGDKIIQLDGHGAVVAAGVLFNATPGNDYCNGWIVPVGMDGGPMGGKVGACLCDCLHIDDLVAILAKKGLDKRPDGE